MAVARVAAVSLAAALATAPSHAQPSPTAATSTAAGTATSDALRDGNAAALAGDWPRVSALVEPLLARPLAPPDRGEAHRLAGIAAFSQHRPGAAEAHILAYLRIDLDGRLDPALYPPEVVAFVNDVALRHAAELRARRDRPARSWLVNLLPPWGQVQNGEPTKAWVVGGALGGLLAINVTSYVLLRVWCDDTGDACTPPPNRRGAISALRPINIASLAGAILVYGYGVYDGAVGYRRRTREHAVEPYASASPDGNVFGIMGRF